MQNFRLLMKKNRIAGQLIGVLLALFSYSPSALAGPITITTEAPFHGSVNVFLSHPIAATGDLAGAVWQLNPADAPALAAIHLSFDPATHTLSGTPVAPGAVNFRVDVINGSSASDEAIFTVIIDRIPLDLMIVLDKSGSMGSSFDGTNGAPPAGQRRWDGLVTGVGVMVNSLNNPANLLPADRIGLRYFESAVTIPTAPYNAGLVPMTPANLTAINTDVATRGPGTNTALGDGILAGRDILLPGSAGNRKAMILFSDGVQNAGDQVKTTGTGAYIQTNSTASLSKSGSDSLTINTICLGSSGDNPTLMQNIAINNGNGEYFNSLVGDNNDFLMSTFLASIQKILSGSSPQYVDVRSSSFKPDSTGKRQTMTEKFTVNKWVSNVFVALAADNRLEPVIQSVMKDGVELIQYVQRASGPGYHTFYVNFPLTYLPNVKPEGEWKITAVAGNSTAGAATGSAGSSNYTISMTVEDHFTHLGFSLTNTDLKVGDTLHPAASILRVGLPLGTATVQALVAKPGDDINDLIARSNVQYTVTPGDSSTPNIYKLAELMKDSAFLAKVKTLDRMVTLSYEPGTKNYTGSFTELDVAGVYRILYHITNTDSTGTINRYYLQSFNVRFKDVDLPQSNVVLSIDTTTRNAIISFRPVSTTGKLIGSGWGATIALSGSTLKIQRIEDVGDGAYKLYLDGPLSGDGTLSINNQPIYTGSLSDIGKGGSGTGGEIWKSWWFWLIILIALIIFWLLTRKKNP
jgi:hypothetical protein